MNVTRLTMLFVIVLAGLTNSASAQDSPEAFLTTWAEAWQTSDVDKMMTFYDTAKETTAIESLGRIRRGPDEIREMYDGAFEEVIFDQVTITPIAGGQLDAVAWMTCRYKAESRLRADGSKFILEVLGSFVMKNDNGSWKITLEHFSTIPDVPRVRPVDD
jgi:ketosteroid isomerase-like protein